MTFRQRPNHAERLRFETLPAIIARHVCDEALRGRTSRAARLVQSVFPACSLPAERVSMAQTASKTHHPLAMPCFYDASTTHVRAGMALSTSAYALEHKHTQSRKPSRTCQR